MGDTPLSAAGALIVDQGDEGLSMCLDGMDPVPLPPASVSLPFYSAQLVSPEGARFAYLDLEVDPRGRLYVVEPDGIARQVPGWATGELWQLIGWLDNDRLALKRMTDFHDTIHTYNTLNGELRDVPAQFPDLSENGPSAITDTGAHAAFPIYDQSLSRVLVERMGPDDRPWGAYELWDVKAASRLWQFAGFWGYRPVWSPDGLRFAVSSTVDGDPQATNPSRTLIVFDRDGVELSRVDQFDGPVAWSHDGNWVAGYRVPNWGCTEECPIGVVLHSPFTGETTEYVMASAGVGAIEQYPVWSPDSSMLAVNSAVLEDDSLSPTAVEVIILDIRDQVSWRIPLQARVLGWIANCPLVQRLSL